MGDFTLDQLISSTQPVRNAGIVDGIDIKTMTEYVKDLIKLMDDSVTLQSSLKILASRLGVDLSTPIAMPVNGVTPASETHKEFFETLNDASETEIQELSGAIRQYLMTKKQGIEEGDNDGNETRSTAGATPGK